MSIAFDAFSASAAGTTISSWTHTTVGDPRGAIVGVGQLEGQQDPVLSATYNGVSMTEVPGSPWGFNAAGQANDFAVGLLFLGSGLPSAGMHTVAVTVGDTSDQKKAYAVTVTTDGGDTEIVDVDGAQSGTLTADGDDMFVCQVSAGSGTSAPLSGWTELDETLTGNDYTTLSAYDTVAGSNVAFGFGTTPSFYIIGAIGIKETAGGVEDQEHTIPVEAYTYAVNPPALVQDHIHAVPTVAYTYETHAPAHEVVTSFTAHGIEFDGSTHLTRGGGLTGAADGKTVTFSGWVNTAQVTTTYFINSTTDNIRVVKNGASGVQVICDNAAGSTIANLRSEGVDIDDGQWHNFLCSFDLADTGKRHLYIDDADALNTTTITYIDDTIDFTLANWSIGATVAGNQQFIGCFAELYFTAEYIDFSVEANRRKFISADGRPVDLGSDGSTPTGNVPLIYLGGNGQDADGWEVNKGGGGGFTENGTLTDCDTDPELDQGITHTIPAAEYEYAAFAPILVQDHIHVLSVEEYTYTTAAPSHAIDVLHHIPVTALEYATVAPVHVVDNSHTLVAEAYAYTVNAPRLAQDHLHYLPVAEYDYAVVAPVHAIDFVYDIPVAEFIYVTHAPTHSVDQAHILPAKAYTYTVHAPEHFAGNEFLIPQIGFVYATYPPVHIGTREVLHNILELDLTPPRETDTELARWLINNFSILQQVLRGGVTGEFETSDSRVLVIKNGIVETIYLP